MWGDVKVCWTFAFFILSAGYDYDEEVDYDIIQLPASSSSSAYGQAQAPRYLLYDVVPGEGFNLRLDVYARLATVVKRLGQRAPWVLVLPPWTRSQHWQHAAEYEDQLPWSRLFDLDSLRSVVPVMEFEDFLQTLPEPIVDETYFVLDPKEKKGENQVEITPCTDALELGYWGRSGSLWSGRLVASKKLRCVASVTKAGHLVPFLLHGTSAGSVLLDKAEDIFHDEDDSSRLYWEIQRSIVYKRELREEGGLFIQQYLNATDPADNDCSTQSCTRNEQQQKRWNKGEPYVAAHLRRGDYEYFYPHRVPTLHNAARQLREALARTRLKTVFIATDSTKEEIETLKSTLKEFRVHLFKPKKRKIRELTDPGVAIVDQWICAKARYFIGTRNSAFSFKIGQLRELLELEPATTFNCFCGQNDTKCAQPSPWLTANSEKAS